MPFILGRPTIGGKSDIVRSGAVLDALAGAQSGRAITIKSKDAQGQDVIESFDGAIFSGILWAGSLNKSAKTCAYTKKGEAILVQTDGSLSGSIGEQVYIAADGRFSSTNTGVPVDARVVSGNMSGLNNDGNEISDCVLIDFTAGY